MEWPSTREWGPHDQFPNINRVLESKLTPTGQKSLARLRGLMGDDLEQQVVQRGLSIELLADV